jgi:hypothetical protein
MGRNNVSTQICATRGKNGTCQATIQECAAAYAYSFMSRYKSEDREAARLAAYRFKGEDMFNQTHFHFVSQSKSLKTLFTCYVLQ